MFSITTQRKAQQSITISLNRPIMCMRWPCNDSMHCSTMYRCSFRYDLVNSNLCCLNDNAACFSSAILISHKVEGRVRYVHLVLLVLSSTVVLYTLVCSSNTLVSGSCIGSFTGGSLTVVRCFTGGSFSIGCCFTGR